MIKKKIGLKLVATAFWQPEKIVGDLRHQKQGCPKQADTLVTKVATSCYGKYPALAVSNFPPLTPWVRNTTFVALTCPWVEDMLDCLRFDLTNQKPPALANVVKMRSSDSGQEKLGWAFRKKKTLSNNLKNYLWINVGFCFWLLRICLGWKC